MKSLAASVKPIIWKRDRLLVLDQRELPRRTIYLNCRSAVQVAASIRDMATRGAPLIGCAAAFGMALAARSGSKTSVEKAGAVLLKSRPTAVNLAHAVAAMLKLARKTPETSLARTLEAAARHYFNEDLASGTRMAIHGAQLLKRGSSVITYCNTGALATSGVGTALGVIRQGFRTGRVKHVYPCETRPYLQGSRLTLWELMQEKIPATLITDNMAAHLMITHAIDAVLVGSDRIAANADVCNKIGTYGLAILARHHGIPFFVVAPTSTVDLSTPVGSRIPIENRSAQEVLQIGGIPLAPFGARAYHFAFDVTPHTLVTAIVTEKGIVRPVNARKLKEICHG